MTGPWAGWRAWGWKVAVALLLGLLGPGLSRASAADQEVRDFAILVDGKPAGQYQLKITRQDDGTVAVNADSECVVKVLFVTGYSYSYHAYESWKGGRLQQFHSSGKEDGKGFDITVAV